MSLAIIQTRACSGLQSPIVTVETHISNGLPCLAIVGLPETAVKESRERVRSALLNNHFEFPTRRITINLAPADLPKEGGRFDLPIALSILVASGQLPKDLLDEHEFVGELALSGALRPVSGILSFALAARDARRKLICPLENADEAALASHLVVLPASHLLQVCAHLTAKQPLQPHACPLFEPTTSALDLVDIHGQAHAKRALEIAAAGRHSLLFIGPPGTGKTMLANRLPGILPPLTEAEALQVATIASASGRVFRLAEWKQRPLRTPHHTASSVALVGGGCPPRPGEISLAHRGVLFLDELPEFSRHVLEALREPLESGMITISRAAYQAEFPADFQLIAAMNPCPCGYWGSESSHRCQCSVERIKRYHTKLSGPLLDRIDMHIEVPLPPRGSLTTPFVGESSAQVRQRVRQAWEYQLQRSGKMNRALSAKELPLVCRTDCQGLALLDRALEQLGLSGRAYHRILRVARTIADLAHRPTVTATHIAEALTYRRLERFASLLN